MKVIIYCAYHNREHPVDILIDPTCETDDVVKITIGKSMLKTGRVEDVLVKQWRSISR